MTGGVRRSATPGSQLSGDASASTGEATAGRLVADVRLAGPHQALWPFASQVKCPALLMSTRHDRPEGYGLVSPSYRLQRRHYAGGGGDGGVRPASSLSHPLVGTTGNLMSVNSVPGPPLSTVGALAAMQQRHEQEARAAEDSAAAPVIGGANLDSAESQLPTSQADVTIPGFIRRVHPVASPVQSVAGTKSDVHRRVGTTRDAMRPATSAAAAVAAAVTPQRSPRGGRDLRTKRPQVWQPGSGTRPSSGDSGGFDHHRELLDGVRRAATPAGSNSVVSASGLRAGLGGGSVVAVSAAVSRSDVVIAQALLGLPGTSLSQWLPAPSLSADARRSLLALRRPTSTTATLTLTPADLSAASITPGHSGGATAAAATALSAQNLALLRPTARETVPGRTGTGPSEAADDGDWPATGEVSQQRLRVASWIEAAAVELAAARRTRGLSNAGCGRDAGAGVAAAATTRTALAAQRLSPSSGGGDPRSSAVSSPAMAVTGPASRDGLRLVLRAGTNNGTAAAIPSLADGTAFVSSLPPALVSNVVNDATIQSLPSPTAAGLETSNSRASVALLGCDTSDLLENTSRTTPSAMSGDAGRTPLAMFPTYPDSLETTLGCTGAVSAASGLSAVSGASGAQGAPVVASISVSAGATAAPAPGPSSAALDALHNSPDAIGRGGASSQDESAGKVSPQSRHRRSTIALAQAAQALGLLPDSGMSGSALALASPTSDSRRASLRDRIAESFQRRSSSSAADPISAARSRRRKPRSVGGDSRTRSGHQQHPGHGSELGSGVVVNGGGGCPTGSGSETLQRKRSLAALRVVRDPFRDVEEDEASDDNEGDGASGGGGGESVNDYRRDVSCAAVENESDTKGSPPTTQTRPARVDQRRHRRPTLQGLESSPSRPPSPSARLSPVASASVSSGSSGSDVMPSLTNAATLAAMSESELQVAAAEKEAREASRQSRRRRSAAATRKGSTPAAAAARPVLDEAAPATSSHAPSPLFVFAQRGLEEVPVVATIGRNTATPPQVALLVPAADESRGGRGWRVRRRSKDSVRASNEAYFRAALAGETVAESSPLCDACLHQLPPPKVLDVCRAEQLARLSETARARVAPPLPRAQRTDWNDSYQRLVDAMYTQPTASATIAAHAAVLALREEFIETSRAFVSSQLSTRLLREVAVEHGGITFVVVTSPALAAAAVVGGAPGLAENAAAADALATAASGSRGAPPVPFTATRETSGRLPDAAATAAAATRDSLLRSTLSLWAGQSAPPPVAGATRGGNSGSTAAALSRIAPSPEDYAATNSAHYAARKLASREIAALSILARVMSASDGGPAPGAEDLPPPAPWQQQQQHQHEVSSAGASLRGDSATTTSAAQSSGGLASNAGQRVCLPLACAVRHLGHVVMCTATLPLMCDPLVRGMRHAAVGGTGASGGSLGSTASSLTWLATNGPGVAPVGATTPAPTPGLFHAPEGDFGASIPDAFQENSGNCPTPASGGGGGALATRVGRIVAEAQDASVVGEGSAEQRVLHGALLLAGRRLGISNFLLAKGWSRYGDAARRAGGSGGAGACDGGGSRFLPGTPSATPGEVPLTPTSAPLVGGGITPASSLLTGPCDVTGMQVVILSSAIRARQANDDTGTRRVYITVASGVMPPLTPTAGHSHHIRLRPELTTTAPELLCADAFRGTLPESVFPEKGAAHVSLVKAMRRINHKAVAQLLDSIAARGQGLTGVGLCDAFHCLGINLCFLGYVGDLIIERIRCIQRTGTTKSVEESTLDAALIVVKEEIVVRSFRHFLDAAWRAAVAVGGSERDMCRVATHHVRVLFGRENSPLTNTFWIQQVTPTARRRFKFRGSLARGDVAIRTALARLADLCGMEVAPPEASIILYAPSANGPGSSESFTVSPSSSSALTAKAGRDALQSSASVGRTSRGGRGAPRIAPRPGSILGSVRRLDTHVTEGNRSDNDEDGTDNDDDNNASSSGGWNQGPVLECVGGNGAEERNWDGSSADENAHEAHGGGVEGIFGSDTSPRRQSGQFESASAAVVGVHTSSQEHSSYGMRSPSPMDASVARSRARTRQRLNAAARTTGTPRQHTSALIHDSEQHARERAAEAAREALLSPASRGRRGDASFTPDDVGGTTSSQLSGPPSRPRVAPAGSDDTLLKLDLRCTRACVVGAVVSLTPTVKAVPVPPVPTLQRFGPTDESCAQELERLAEACLRRSDNSGAAAALLRQAESLCLVGDRCFSAAERVLLCRLHTQERAMVLDARACVDSHMALARLYSVEHRYREVQRHASAAVAIEGRAVHPFSLRLVPMYRVLAAAAKDGGFRTVAVSALESCCAVLARHVRDLPRRSVVAHLMAATTAAGTNRATCGASASSVASVGEKPSLTPRLSPRHNTGPTAHEQLLWEMFGSVEATLAAVVDDLCAMYPLVKTSEYPAFEPVAKSSDFLRLLHRVAVEQLRRHNIFPAHCALFRAVQLAEYLAETSQLPKKVLDRCRANLDRVEAIAT